MVDVLPPDSDTEVADAEALFPEAKQRAKRRHLWTTAVCVAAVVVLGVLAWLVASRLTQPTKGPPKNAQAGAALACSPSALKTVWAGFVSPVTAQDPIGFKVENAGSTSCELNGYPGLILKDAAGKPVEMATSHAGNPEVTGASPHTVLLKEGQAAYVRISKTPCYGGDADFVASVQLTSGGSAISGKISQRTFYPEDRAYFASCVDQADSGSTVFVSPFEPSMLKAFGDA